MQNSRNYTLLKYIWQGWHEASGAKMRHIFTQTVQLNNIAARESGYSDFSESWIEEFEENNFEHVMDGLLEQLKPLYNQMHAYVRHKLELVYGSEYPSYHNKNLIPAHLFG
jgi:peptidyl-dipeptidase A